MQLRHTRVTGCFGSMFIIHPHRGDPAGDDHPLACVQGAHFTMVLLSRSKATWKVLLQLLWCSWWLFSPATLGFPTKCPVQKPLQLRPCASFSRTDKGDFVPIRALPGLLDPCGDGVSYEPLPRHSGHAGVSAGPQQCRLAGHHTLPGSGTWVWLVLTSKALSRWS